MNSTVTIPLSEYKLMEKRLARKKDELISVRYDTYYWTKKQKELVMEMEEDRRWIQEELRKIKEQFKKVEWDGADCKIIQKDPSEIISNYKKAIRNLYMALWISLITIVILTII